MNLFSPLPDAPATEQVTPLLTRPGLRVERIVSLGQASPPGFWYDQAEGEWVLLLAGAAKLRFAKEPELRMLQPRRLARHRPAPASQAAAGIETHFFTASPCSDGAFAVANRLISHLYQEY